MNGNPTTKQNKFHEWCRNRVCVINGTPNPALHHIKGGKMKLKGVVKAGEWYVLPVSYWWHQDGNNPNAIHVNRSNFVKTLNMTEKDYWLELMIDYHHEFGNFPMSQEEYIIIKDRA
jgi:hypothetical protein